MYIAVYMYNMIYYYCIHCIIYNNIISHHITTYHIISYDIIYVDIYIYIQYYISYNLINICISSPDCLAEISQGLPRQHAGAEKNLERWRSMFFNVIANYSICHRFYMFSNDLLVIIN